MLISLVSGSISTIAACMPEAKVDRGRRVVVAGFQARRFALGHRWAVRVGGAGELGGGLGRLVEGVPQRVGQHGDLAEFGMRRRGVALDRDDPVDDLQVVRVGTPARRRPPAAPWPAPSGRPAPPRSRTSPRPGRRRCRPRSRSGGCRRWSPAPSRTARPARRRRSARTPSGGPGPARSARWRPRRCRRSAPGRARPRTVPARFPRRSSRFRCRAAGPRRAACAFRSAKSSQPISSLIISSWAG